MYVDGEIAGREELRQAASAYYLASGGDPMAMGAAMVWMIEIDTHLVMLRSIKAMTG